MDEIKKRIGFQNNGVQIQAVWRLTQELIKKKPPNSLVDSSSPEIPELNLLLDCLCGEDEAVVEAASHALVHLVERRVLEFTFALNSVLNNVPSARILSGIVKAVYRLLTLQAMALQTTGTKYKCPYGLRSPPHPLISVVTNRPEAWPFIVEQATLQLKHENERIQQVAIEILRPYVTFLLAEPQQSDHFSGARTGLQRILLAVYRSGSDDQSLKMTRIMLQSLAKTPIDTKSSAMFIIQLTEDLTSLVTDKFSTLKQTDLDTGARGMSSRRSDWLSTGGKLFTYGLEISLRCSEAGVAFATFLTQLIQLGQLGLGAVNASTNLLLLSDMLKSALIFTYPQLIVLAQSVVSSCPASVNSLCLASLIKPLLQILALPCGKQVTSLSQHQAKLRATAGQFLLDIQTRLAAGSATCHDQISSLPLHMSSPGYQCELVLDLCQRLTQDKGDQVQSTVQHRQDYSSSLEHLVAWLNNVRASLHQREACSTYLIHVVSAVLITAKSALVTRAALDAIIKIAQLDSRQAPDFLPLALYVLGQNQNPESRLALLETIPQLATHKFCVPPILKTIQALGKSDDLKVLPLRLMVLLWKLQDRVFPQLLKAINEPQCKTGTGMTDNFLLAKAAAIVEICKHKPEQHGADLLAPLSDILNEASDESDTAASSLALDGLYLLCQAEVVDLRSLWSVLGDKLIHETRPVVITRVCHLLSLVPELAVETEEYEAFAQDAVSSLWLYSMSTNSLVSCAAYQALSKYNVEQFRVSYLPRHVTQELHHQAELAVKQSADGARSSEVDVDQLFPQIPGSCYMSLLQSQTDEEKMNGYKSLHAALVNKEATSLPRGVFHSSLRRQGLAANQGKAIEVIPAFLLQQYDKCKQPGLRPGLAAGLLFCYDPPLEVGRDGRPRKHYIVRHGKTFLQTFTTLLQEIPVQPSDWHRCALMPQAWNSFMERLFLSLLESRKAELDLEEKHGHLAVFETEEKKSFAWLWVRDSIMEVIKTASMGAPAAQANCVLALAGLALCLHCYTADLDPEILQAADTSSDHMGHIHWLTVTCDTILSLIDVEYKPKGGLHGLCQQRSTLDRAPASSLCNGMARLAASQLVRVYIAKDTDRIVQLLNMFTAALPKGAKPLELPTLIFCNGLALGMLLARLFEEHYSEMTGSKGMLAVWKSLTALENICLTTDAENQQGCILGLGLAVCGMCAEGKTESRVHVTSVLEKLQNLWLNTPVENAAYQSFCVTVTSIAASVYASNTSSEDVVLPIVEKLKQVHHENPQVSGISLALGLLTYSLSKHGSRSVASLRQELVSLWLQDVTKEDTPAMEKVSKLNGLLSMIGSEQTLVPVQGSSMMTGSDVNVTEVITLVTKIVVSHSDLGLQNVSAWMLGHLYLSACAVAENRSSVPPNFGYLPESSILRAVVDFLLEAGRLGSESVPISHVIAALECLNVKAGLPPLNWAAVLSPFMRVNYGEKVQTLSLQVAAAQMVTSSSAVIFVSSWLTPPLFTSLQPSTQASLHHYMPEMIKSISPAVLKIYLERSCLPAFTESSNVSLQTSILYGLGDALAVDDPPDVVTMLLHEAAGQLYHVLLDKFSIPVLQAMAECLAQVPDDILDSIIDADFADATTQIKGSFVRCHLVAIGKQPLSLLNYMIDASFNNDYWNHNTGMLLLLHCLSVSSKNKGELSGLTVRQEWLCELLGHTRSIVTGAVPLAETAPSMEKVINHVMNVVTCCALTLTYPNYTDLELWGLNIKLFTSEKVNQAFHKDAEGFATGLEMPSLGEMYASLAKFLPAVVNVLTKKPWDVIVPKIIDWLMTLLQLSETTPEGREALLASLMVLRHSPEFRHVTIWARAAQFSDMYDELE